MPRVPLALRRSRCCAAPHLDPPREQRMCGGKWSRRTGPLDAPSWAPAVAAGRDHAAGDEDAPARATSRSLSQWRWTRTRSACRRDPLADAAGRPPRLWGDDTCWSCRHLYAVWSHMPITVAKPSQALRQSRCGDGILGVPTDAFAPEEAPRTDRRQTWTCPCPRSPFTMSSPLPPLKVRRKQGPPRFLGQDGGA